MLVPAGSEGLTNPQRVAFGPDGNLYVASFGIFPTETQEEVLGSILRYNPETGEFLGTFVASGTGGLRHPSALRFGPDGRLYVSDGFGSGNILRYNAATGAFLDALSQPGVFPFDLAFGRDGLLYVVSGTADASVVRFNPATGTFVDTFIPSGSGLAFPAGLTFGPDGNLYIGVGGEGGADNTVRRFDGTTLSTFASPVPAIGPSFLTDIVFGPDNHLYVSGFVNGTVIRYDGATGAFVDVFATDGFGLSGLAFTPRTGEVASDPILPRVDETGTFFCEGLVVVLPNGVLWCDPIVAVGYDYMVVSGPNVQSVQLLNIGDGLFDLYLFDTDQNEFVFSTVFEAGVAHDFGPGGVDRFRILGIETDAALDPTDPTAFPTGLTFVEAGTVDLAMKPITEVVGDGPCAADLSDRISVIRGGYRKNRTTGRYLQQVTLTNPDTAPIEGPVSLVLDNLSPNATLFNKAGDTGCAEPAGSPFIDVAMSEDNQLDPGENATVILEFTNPTSEGITYDTRVLAGPGDR